MGKTAKIRPANPIADRIVFLIGAGQGTQNTVHIKPGVVQLGQKHQLHRRIGNTAALGGGSCLGSIQSRQVYAAAALGYGKFRGF